jgi:hypothetical protein
MYSFHRYYHTNGTSVTLRGKKGPRPFLRQPTAPRGPGFAWWVATTANTVPYSVSDSGVCSQCADSAQFEQRILGRAGLFPWRGN